jgi:putative membrane protein
MKHILSERDKKILDKCISDAEAKSGTQIVLATVHRSDSYSEIPWKAFALGVSVTSLAVFLLDIFSPQWITGRTLLISVVSIIGMGALFSLLTLVLPVFARLFLSASRIKSETVQYAEALFLSHELFATEKRRGLLLLVSIFEREVVILPDTGLRERLTKGEMKGIISGMTPFLRSNDVRKALETGLEALVVSLSPSTGKGIGKNELSNEIIEEESK